MSDLRTQLVETADALLMRGAALTAYEEAGFGLLLGELGGDCGDAVAILQRVGYHDPSLPLAPLMNADMPLASVALASGALHRCLDLCIEHANGRVQFGKALSKQQAVQQSLALLAEEVAAVAVCAEALGAARDRGDADFELACAKLRTNRAIAIGTTIAHQVHGAIGFTQDYPLHSFTRALTLWRSSAGSEAYWANKVAETAIGLGGRGLWDEITRRSDGQAPS